MGRRGRKNVSGSWLHGVLLERGLQALTVLMATTGFVLGFIVRGVPAVDDIARGLAWWTVVSSEALLMIAMYGAVIVFLKRTEATWGSRFDAERRVGDRIEHALVQSGCAFAHDVREALGGGGNVDHVALTPVGIWVVETKAAWLEGELFQDALPTGGKQRGAGGSAFGNEDSDPGRIGDRRRFDAFRVGARLGRNASDRVRCRVLLETSPSRVRRWRVGRGGRTDAGPADGLESRFHRTLGRVTRNTLAADCRLFGRASRSGLKSRATGRFRSVRFVGPRQHVGTKLLLINRLKSFTHSNGTTKPFARRCGPPFRPLSPLTRNGQRRPYADRRNGHQGDRFPGTTLGARAAGPHPREPRLAARMRAGGPRSQGCALVGLSSSGRLSLARSRIADARLTGRAPRSRGT